MLTFSSFDKDEDYSKVVMVLGKFFIVTAASILDNEKPTRSNMKPSPTLQKKTFLVIFVSLIYSFKLGALVLADNEADGDNEVRIEGLERPDSYVVNDDRFAKIEEEENESSTSTDSEGTSSEMGGETINRENKRLWGSTTSSLPNKQLHSQLDPEANYLNTDNDAPVGDPKILRRKERMKSDSEHDSMGWGAASTVEEQLSDMGTEKGENATTKSGISTAHLPFLGSKKNMVGSSAEGGSVHVRSPPEGFVISSRVYLDTIDKLAHFDSPITLPYWECGAFGTTTSPLSIRNAYFRHALSTSTTSWTGSDGGDKMNPVLLVVLSPTVIELNSGASEEFQAGEVVLLEDMLLPGHKLKPAHANQDLKVLFLTLPQAHYHAGKKHLSIKSSIKLDKHGDPCPDIEAGRVDEKDIEQPLSRSAKAALFGFFNAIVDSWTGRRVRLSMLVAIGLSLSTLVADFLGKTAPLWLAVGVGGTFFVATGTAGFTLAADNLLTSLELWRERRRFGRTSASYETEDDDSQNPEIELN